mmetsp:Transcript_2339/g.9722  ORF Transcript_2339/g.9722 Transcript_2339/m.9722 type:complete len:428 (-) Transcript_2339:147-1430(-)
MGSRRTLRSGVAREAVRAVPHARVHHRRRELRREPLAVQISERRRGGGDAGVRPDVAPEAKRTGHGRELCVRGEVPRDQRAAVLQRQQHRERARGALRAPTRDAALGRARREKPVRERRQGNRRPDGDERRRAFSIRSRNVLYLLLRLLRRLGARQEFHLEAPEQGRARGFQRRQRPRRRRGDSCRCFVPGGTCAFERRLRALKLARRGDAPRVAGDGSERATRGGGGVGIRRCRLERLGILRGVVQRDGGDPEQRAEHTTREHARGERVEGGAPRPGGQRARQRRHRLDGGDCAVHVVVFCQIVFGVCARRSPLGGVRGVLQLQCDHQRELPRELCGGHERRAARADRAVFDGGRYRRRANRRGHGELAHGAAGEPKRPGRRRRPRGRRHQSQRAVERRAVCGARSERAVRAIVRPAAQRVQGSRG